MANKQVVKVLNEQVYLIGIPTKFIQTTKPSTRSTTRNTLYRNNIAPISDNAVYVSLHLNYYGCLGVSPHMIVPGLCYGNKDKSID